jgi:fructosamine-3-kinase
MLLQPVLDDCNLSITRYEPVHGGDINRCYCLCTKDSKYFLKLNDAVQYPGMFEREADGLKALADNFKMVVPTVIKHGTAGQQQYLLLKWVEAGKPADDTWEKFGKALANMHMQPRPYFGWSVNNYIGSLEQWNAKHETWGAFYTECRIMPLVKKLFDLRTFNKQDVAYAISMCKKTGLLFGEEPATLLHGDLWSGNIMIAAGGQAAIYDPAVYYGHREMDIGMTKLFGGFDQRFYDAYNDVYPLEKDWQHRLPLTQLYPLLVHAILFGGHYVSGAKANLAKW